MRSSPPGSPLEHRQSQPLLSVEICRDPRLGLHMMHLKTLLCVGYTILKEFSVGWIMIL